MNLELPKIGIVGLGFVGGAISFAMESDSFVHKVDKDPTKSTHTFADLHRCEGVFVCVPTPFGDDGKCDTSILEYVLEQLKDYEGVIISKCTAPPLVYRALNERYPNLVHAPEFLTAADAVQDYIRGKFAFVGGRIKAYRDLAEKIIRIGQRDLREVIHCSIEEASLAKYLINTYLATKVVYMNEMYQLCENLNVDYKIVAEMAMLDPRIGTSHMKVPGPDKSFGYGGLCFPKDTAALLKIAEEVGVPLNVLESAVKKNTILRLSSE